MEKEKNIPEPPRWIRILRDALEEEIKQETPKEKKLGTTTE